MQMIILVACASIACIVFGVMLYSIAVFRAPVGSTPSAFRQRRGIELLWALIPIMIVIGTAAPAVGALLPADTSVMFTYSVAPAN